MAAGNFETYKSDGSIGGNALEWVDARFPATSMWKAHLSEYYAPKNFNFWYFFGSLAFEDKGTQIDLDGNHHEKKVERKSFFRRAGLEQRFAAYRLGDGLLHGQ